MAKAYWVVTYRAINNQDAFAAYAKLAVAAVQEAGGRFIVRANPAKTYEGGINQRVVLIEFDSLQKALAGCMGICQEVPRGAYPHISSSVSLFDL